MQRPTSLSQWGARPPPLTHLSALSLRISGSNTAPAEQEKTAAVSFLRRRYPPPPTGLTGEAQPMAQNSARIPRRGKMVLVAVLTET